MSIDRKLWNAAWRDKEVLVSQLIEEGAKVDWGDNDNWTALHNASRAGHTTLVSRLLDAGWSLENRTKRYGLTPLALAAEKGHLDTVKCLLLRGAQIDTQSNDKRTPLQLASLNNHSDLIQFLLMCGANEEIENKNNIDNTMAVFRDFRKDFSVKGLDTKKELFVWAMKENRFDIAAILAYNSQHTNTLYKFLEILDTEKIKSLFVMDFLHRSLSKNPTTALKLNILQYFNENSTSFNGNNTFHHGALIQSVEFLKMSLEHGVNIEEKNLEGNTPLHIAATLENVEPLKYLIDNGSNIEEKNMKGDTPLHITVKSKNIEPLKYLLENGSNIEEKNFEGDTPLYTSLKSGNVGISKYLIKRGSNVEEKNSEGNTLLHIAAAIKDEKIVNQELINFLIENGSNIEEKNFEGDTSLHLALKSGNERISKYLINRGSNVEGKNSEGNTPLHIAAASKDEKIVKNLLDNGASYTQFMKNNDGQIPLEVARHNTRIFRIILIDFLNYALKSPQFFSNEFQKELGSELELFCLKRDFDGKTLLEFLNDQGMIKEREELIQLLIKIDHFRFKEQKNSQRRVIKILRAGMNSSRGLKKSIDSVQEKYSWGSSKIRRKCWISFAQNLLWGWSLFSSDVLSDVFFYNGLDQDDPARIVALVHIILPFVFSFIFLIIMLYSKLVTFNWYLLLKIPSPPVAKLYKAIIECKSFSNNKNIEDSNYENRKTDLIKELENQKKITTISMILEASMESSFQFLLQGLFSLATLVFSVMDIYEGRMKIIDLLNWKIVSIVLSFLSFAFTSFTIR